MPGALFVSAALSPSHGRDFASEGVGLRAPALGLGEVAIEVATVSDVMDAAHRLRARDLPVDLDTGSDAASLKVLDPWGNQVRVATPQHAS